MVTKKIRKSYDDYHVNKLSTFQVRLPEALKDRFLQLCDENDSSGAKEIRKFIKRYLENGGSDELFRKKQGEALF